MVFQTDGYFCFMRKLLTGVFMILYFISAAQKGILKGEVFNGNEPLSSASVSINKMKLVTDEKGRFTIELEAGAYSLSVTMVGYQEYKNQVILSGEEKLLKISLQPMDEIMEDIVVTGTLRPVQKLQSPIAVEVYNPQFFKRNPTPSLFESMQNVNGVRPQINCSVCNTGDIHINGLEGPYTMVTIDGMPIVSSLASVYGLSGIPSHLIERVEIVKGPASGLYGSEAIGGLINIITKSPEKAPLFTGSLMSTNWKEHNLDLGVKWKMNKVNSILGLNYYNYLNPIDKNDDNFTDVTLQHRLSVFNKWSLNRKDQRKANLAMRYYTEDRWGGEMQFEKKYRGGDSLYGESIYTKRWELTGNYQLPLKEKLLFSFSASHHEQNSYYGVTPYLAKQKIWFNQLTWDRRLGRDHNMLTGITSRYNYYDDNSTATIDTLNQVNAPEKAFIPGLFLQDEWQTGNKTILLLGARYDFHPVHKSIFTPRVAFKWSISGTETFRLNAGTGFRVVNLFTEDHAALTGARAVEITEELQPEKSYNINLNYSKELGSYSKRFNIDASVWYSFFHNQIIADYESDPNKIIYSNLKGNAISKGVTLNMDINLMQRLRGNLGMTLQEVSKVEEEGGKKIKIQPVLTERWSGVWSLSYSFPIPGITIDYTGNVYGPMKLPILSALDPRRPTSEVWSIQNVQVTKWVSKSFEIFGGVKNLLNWTPAKNNPFIIARAHDPFDKDVVYDNEGNVMATADNPYALTFDPSYIYAANQGIRLFAGVRFTVK